MTIKKTIRVLFVLCLFAAGCGGNEAPGPPPQGQRPPSVFDDPAPACYGFVRHGPFVADFENIDERRSFQRLCDAARSLDPIGCFPGGALEWHTEEPDCNVTCPDSDASCVRVFGDFKHPSGQIVRQAIVGTLNSERFRDILSPRPEDIYPCGAGGIRCEPRQLQLYRDRTDGRNDRGEFLSRKCPLARDIERRCH